MTLKNNRTPLLSNIKLCVSFHHHMWIQTGVTVQKRLSWVLTSVTLTFDLWPWPFAWTSLLSLVITPENFMIQWWEHSEKGVTGRRTDRQTDIHSETPMKNIYFRVSGACHSLTARPYYVWASEYECMVLVNHHYSIRGLYLNQQTAELH